MENGLIWKCMDCYTRIRADKDQMLECNFHIDTLSLMVYTYTNVAWDLDDLAIPDGSSEY